MRRGYTLVELLVAMAVLATITTVSLRLVFMLDRALGIQEQQAAATGGTMTLLTDAGADLREASGVSGGGAVQIGGPRGVTYTWQAGREVTVRGVAGRPDATREYPGCRLTVTAQGRMATIVVRSGRTERSTRVYMRN